MGKSNAERLEEHRAAAEYLRSGIFEQKPWLKGAVSFDGPASDHEEMVRRLESNTKGGR